VLSQVDVNPEINALTQRFIVILDSWVDVNKAGWYYSQVSAAAEKKDEASLIIAKSLKRYLSTAIELRKPLDGAQASYENFWKRCYERLFFYYFVKLSKIYDLPHAKRDIYGLIQLRKYIQLPQKVDLNDADRATLVDDLTRVIRIYLSRVSQNKKYILTVADVKAARDLHNNVLNRYFQLRDLKNAFEDLPHVYMKYVHIRPSILIRFAQILDYIITKVEGLGKGSWLPFYRENDAPIIELLVRLNDIRQEIAEMMLFQERLLLTPDLERDDLIEAMQQLVQCGDYHFLPRETFFEFTNQQSFSIEAFTDREIGLGVPPHQQSAWRQNYIMKYVEAKNKEVTPIPFAELWAWHETLLTGNESAPSAELPIALARLVMVDPLKLSTQGIYVPSLVLDAILVEKPIDLTLGSASASSAIGLFASSVLTINQFFIDDYDARERFLAINQAVPMIDSLYKKTSNGVRFNRSNLNWVGGSPVASQDVIREMLLLRDAIYLIEKELESTKKVVSCPAMKSYMALVHSIQVALRPKIEAIVDAVMEGVKHINSGDGSPIASVKKALRQVIVELKDAKRLDYYNKHMTNAKELEDKQQSAADYYLSAISRSMPSS
jgi:hypothetical protein